MHINCISRNLAFQVARDFVLPDSLQKVTWEDIVGQDEVKESLKETLILPFKFPELFQKSGLKHGKEAILLAGPPGTGKTTLAKVVAQECQMAFLNVSGSSLTSKWRGESEKLMRVLFEIAEHNSPCIIFMDEIDAILGDRGKQKT